MDKKVEYVREHFNKDVRKILVNGRNEKMELNNGYTLRRKKQRVWTLNRSPHGNKTAREQFGRQVWQRRVKRENKESLEGRKQLMGQKNEYVSRKEIQKGKY